MLKQIKIFLTETLEVFLIALAIVLPIRYFVVQPFFVKGQSMEPSFYDQDYLIIDELSYRFRQPERGEVVVFRSPVAPSSYYIKRIIGLPNETVEMKDGQIIIYTQGHPEGEILKESYLPKDLKSFGDIKITLKPDEYFVLGDNRNVSYDSRSWGPLQKKYVVGRVYLRLFPFNRVEAFSVPQYSF